MTIQRSSHPGRVLLAGLSACLLAVGLGAGSAAGAGASMGAGNPAPHSWHVLVGAQAGNRAIQTMGFYPSHLWVDQGDTVTWQANSAEIHTVTFLSSTSPCPTSALCALPSAFDPADPTQSTPQGSSTYDGSSYYNSGVMTSATGDTGPLPPFVHVQKSYSLTFPASLAPGTYVYYCVVHGMAMQGSVIVQAAGTPYPFSQRSYDHQNRQRMSRDIADGYRLWHNARQADRRLSRTQGPTVLVGAMDQAAMVMRFIGANRAIRVGERVRFQSTSMGEPHTVTFGSDETGCGTPPCNPQMPWNVSRAADGNETANYPGSNAGYTGARTNLNSGLLLDLPPSVTGLPTKLTVSLTRAGTYHYTCALHDYMGMTGNLRVHHRR